MSENIIDIESLSKFYGAHRGLVNLSLEIGSGEIFGYLGPNGSGKTTTIRLLLGSIRASSGNARIFGMDVNTESKEIHKRIGFLPGEFKTYDNLKASELFHFLGNMRGMADWHYTQDLIDRLDLDATRTIKELSKGNKQKVGLIQACMHKPDLLLLDEPTSGLDPISQREFYSIVKEMACNGTTVFMSSHVITEVERVADRVAILKEGALILDESIEHLKSKAAKQVEIHFAENVYLDSFEGLPDIRDLTVNGPMLQCIVEGSMDQLVKRASQFTVYNIISMEPALEEIFLEYYS